MFPNITPDTYTIEVTSASFKTMRRTALANNQYNADGRVNPSRLKPKDAGFGAANAANAMRNIQLHLRFQF